MTFSSCKSRRRYVLWGIFECPMTCSNWLIYLFSVKCVFWTSNIHKNCKRGVENIVDVSLASLSLVNDRVVIRVWEALCNAYTRQHIFCMYNPPNLDKSRQLRTILWLFCPSAEASLVFPRANQRNDVEDPHCQTTCKVERFIQGTTQNKSSWSQNKSSWSYSGSLDFKSRVQTTRQSSSFW